MTTDAVMSGAWALPDEKRLVLLFVNVADKAVSARLDFDAQGYGLESEELTVVKIAAEGTDEAFPTPPVFQRELTFPARTAEFRLE